MKIAVNVADLTRHNGLVTQLLVGPHATRWELTDCGPNLDDGALVLECEEMQARAIVDVLRIKDLRVKQYATRAYSQGPRGGWSKI